MIEVHNQSGGNYSVKKEKRITTPMVRADLYDYSDTHTFVKGVITVTNPDNTKRNKIVAFKNIAPLIKCISKIKNVLIQCLCTI